MKTIRRLYLCEIGIKLWGRTGRLLRRNDLQQWKLFCSIEQPLFHPGFREIGDGVSFVGGVFAETTARSSPA
jgi:hypothetical protein